MSDPSADPIAQSGVRNDLLTAAGSETVGIEEIKKDLGQRCQEGVGGGQELRGRFVQHLRAP